MVRHPARRPEAGAIVEVVNRDGTFVGRGFYHPRGTIAVRLLTEDPAEAVDAGFFLRRLERAKSFREDVLRLTAETDSYRLAHGEADGLSGVVIDKFAGVVVVEPFTAGVLTAGDWIGAALLQLYPGASVAFRPSPKTELREGASFGSLAERFPVPERVEIRERGLRFSVDFASGHKTGFFLDQRDNRAAVGALAAGRDVLDLCCYTGGFALYAARGGAHSVTAVDLDEDALAVARSNARLNGFREEGEGGCLAFRHENAFDFLRAALAAGRQADLVVLDPAKLANVKAEIPRALRMYGDLNRLAVQAVRPGGIFVTCSCSGLVSEETFRSVVCRAAAEAGAVLQIFDVRGAAADHPVSSIFPEGRYLKVLFGRVLPRRW